MKEVGVFGLTGNPPHVFHVLVPQAAYEQFGLSEVIFVPSGQPPHKWNVLDAESRYALVRAAVAGIRHFSVSRTEVDRPGPSLTIDTLKELQGRLGSDAHLNYILGEDNVYEIGRWDGADEIFQTARLLVAPRYSLTDAHVDEWRRVLPAAELDAIDCPGSAVSSKLVRDWIAKGRSIEFLVPPGVLRLINTNGYYGKGLT